MQERGLKFFGNLKSEKRQEHVCENFEFLVKNSWQTFERFSVYTFSKISLKLNKDKFQKIFQRVTGQMALVENNANAIQNQSLTFIQTAIRFGRFLYGNYVRPSVRH